MAAINQKIRRLPGFRFEAVVPSRENVLPRMDVAFFVGFAASGPIGIPVVLETAEEFARVFGKDLPLVWDREKGETVYAFLAPTVRAFFRNGGKRCWVIRVARRIASPEKRLNRACYNFFTLPGVACLRFDKDHPEEFLPAFARSRSKGSWSDDLQVGTAVLSRAVEFVDLLDANAASPPTSPPAKEKILYLEIPANESIKTGELLRVHYSDEGVTLFLTAERIEDGAGYYSPPVGRSIVKVTSKRFVWLEEFPAVMSPPVIVSPDEAEKVYVHMWTHRDTHHSQNILKTFFAVRSAELTVDPLKKNGTEETPPKINLKFRGLAARKAPAAGSLLITNFRGKSLCLQVETVNIADVKTQTGVEVTCRGVFCPIEAAPVSTPSVERWAFELWIKEGEKSLTKLSDLEFNAGSDRFWGNLPVDDDLFRFSESREKDAPDVPARTSDLANFPIAGNGDRDGFYFPLFPTAVPEKYLGAIKIPGTKLQRDGLEEFDADLFLDEKLKNTGLNNLLNDGEFIRYLSARPRSLWGIHSALVPETTITAAAGSTPTDQTFASLSLDEATIVSVPDALHRGWLKVQEDLNVSPPPLSSPPERLEWWHFLDCPREPEIKRVSQPEWENFLDCSLRVIATPENLQPKEGKPTTGKFTLIWECAEPMETSPPSPKEKFPRFVLEESTSSSFAAAQQIYTGKEKEFNVSGRGAGIYYYRVRAEVSCSEFSDWSVGLAVKIPQAESWVVNFANDYQADVLFAVQRALLRMCAARGDLFAVLDLPEHYDRDAAVKHIATLKTTKGLTSLSSGVEPFSADETKALSYGAAYHPWLMTREDGFEAVRNIPAGGMICGVMANRAIRRGAWIAPANEPLQGVLGLATPIERESFFDFQDNLINLVRQEPTGFLVLDSDTLSDHPELRQINVRRLLSLLRRLALKRGAAYVFEPNDERFRRTVQRGFASLLDLMFVRGAFAGNTPATSYQVVVDGSVNNFQSVEQGRFIVELRVAPSLPLKFVTVRLVQVGGRSSVTEVF